MHRYVAAIGMTGNTARLFGRGPAFYRGIEKEITRDVFDGTDIAKHKHCQSVSAQTSDQG
jgi:hypothetical protein